MGVGIIRWELDMNIQLQQYFIYFISLVGSKVQDYRKVRKMKRK